MHDQAGRTRPGRPRHLAAIPASIPAPRPGRDDRPIAYTLTGRAETLLTARVRLDLWQRAEVEDARRIADQLAEADAADLTPGQAAFHVGRICGVALNLLDIIDAITEP